MNCLSEKRRFDVKRYFRAVFTLTHSAHKVYLMAENSLMAL